MRFGSLMVRFFPSLHVSCGLILSSLPRGRNADEAGRARWQAQTTGGGTYDLVIMSTC